VPAGAAVDLGPLVPVDVYERAVQETLGRADVDALIAIYACIGDCDPEVVGRAIRRGVRRAERETGVAKPALLCLIGGAAAVHAQRDQEERARRDEDASGHVDDDARSPAGRRTFPLYRFPESAALALAQAVQYAAFRGRPAGRLRWFEDVDAASARQDVAASLAAAGGEALVLDGEPARRILGFFGIRGAPEVPGGGPPLRVEIRSDPSFGPLLRVERTPGAAVVRITPLTDNEVREVIAAAGVPASAAVEELLARVSQMIEELPWLTAMDCGVDVSPNGASAHASGARLTFHVPAAALPRMTSDSVELRR
jgi:hypothetical protein